MKDIVKLYNQFIECSNDSDWSDPKKVGWSTKHEQEVRFKVLLNIGVKENDKILDYGCGLGHLIDYLDKNNIKVDYTGLDINPTYLEIAKETHKESLFKLGDIDDESDEYDWVLASGVFTYGITDEEIESKVSKGVSIAKKGFAFNMLIPSEDFIAYGFNVFDPLETLSDFKQKYDNVYIAQGYTHDDFTIYITKEPLNYDFK